MIAGRTSAVMYKINPAIAALQDIERTMREGTGADGQLAVFLAAHSRWQSRSRSYCHRKRTRV